MLSQSIEVSFVQKDSTGAGIYMSNNVISILFIEVLMCCAASSVGTKSVLHHKHVVNRTG
jgi:hypothetical protein